MAEREGDRGHPLRRSGAAVAQGLGPISRTLRRGGLAPRLEGFGGNVLGLVVRDGRTEELVTCDEELDDIKQCDGGLDQWQERRGAGARPNAVSRSGSVVDSASAPATSAFARQIPVSGGESSSSILARPSSPFGTRTQISAECSSAGGRFASHVAAARRWPCRGSDAVLEIDDYGVGSAFESLLELA